MKLSKIEFHNIPGIDLPIDINKTENTIYVNVTSKGVLIAPEEVDRIFKLAIEEEVQSSLGRRERVSDCL